MSDLHSGDKMSPLGATHRPEEQAKRPLAERDQRRAEPRELALRLDDGTLIRDPDWRCVADVMKSFAHFGVKIAYGTIVYADTGEIHPHHKPDTAATQRTTRPLG